MAVTHHTWVPTPEPVTEAHGLEILDRQAQRWLGMPGDEFLERWDRGDFSGAEDERPEVTRVAMLIPLARQH